MPQIEISANTLARQKRYVEPLVDTFDTLDDLAYEVPSQAQTVQFVDGPFFDQKSMDYGVVMGKVMAIAPLRPLSSPTGASCGILRLSSATPSCEGSGNSK
jgi:hypothetical protein